MKKFARNLGLALVALFFVACGSQSASDVAKDFTRELFEGEAKKVVDMMYLGEKEVAEEDKAVINAKIAAAVAKNQKNAKQRGGIKDIIIEKEVIDGDSARIRTLVIFKDDSNESSGNIDLVKINDEWLVKLPF